MWGALYDFHAIPLEAVIDGPRLRKRLLSHASGKVLEVGAGTGINFQYYPAGVEVTAVEPDESMRRQAIAKAKQYPHVHVGTASAEALPFPDASFDAVVATLTLCSVDDPQVAIREMTRVLKPQGHLLLLDHVRKNTPVAGKVLDWFTPGWKRLTGGCHLNRDPGEWIAQQPLQVERQDEVWKGYGSFRVLRKSG